MKQQLARQTNKRNKKLDQIPRIFYRADSHCSEFGSWYFNTNELGEVGPFDTREDAKEALDMSLLLNPSYKKLQKHSLH